jgi:hypothetical protein
MRISGAAGQPSGRAPRPNCPPTPSSHQPRQHPQRAAAADTQRASAAEPSLPRWAAAARSGDPRKRLPPEGAAEVRRQVRRQVRAEHRLPAPVPSFAQLFAQALVRLLARALVRLLARAPMQPAAPRPALGARQVAQPVRRSRRAAEQRKSRNIACERAPTSELPLANAGGPLSQTRRHSARCRANLVHHCYNNDHANGRLTIPLGVLIHAYKSVVTHARAAHPPLRQEPR